MKQVTGILKLPPLPASLPTSLPIKVIFRRIQDIEFYEVKYYMFILGTYQD